MIHYLVKPYASPTWHDVKPCLAPMKTNDGMPYVLHFATHEGVIICSAYDDHELIVVDETDKLRHYNVSAREHFQEIFDREELTNG